MSNQPPAQTLRELVESWRKSAQTHDNYAHYRDEPYDDVAHEHRVKAARLRKCADELAAALAAPGTMSQTLREACRLAMEACRDNLKMYDYKNEQALLAAFKACEAALAAQEAAPRSDAHDAIARANQFILDCEMGPDCTLCETLRALVAALEEAKKGNYIHDSLA